MDDVNKTKQKCVFWHQVDRSFSVDVIANVEILLFFAFDRMSTRFVRIARAQPRILHTITPIIPKEILICSLPYQVKWYCHVFFFVLFLRLRIILLLLVRRTDALLNERRTIKNAPICQ